MERESMDEFGRHETGRGSVTAGRDLLGPGTESTGGHDAGWQDAGGHDAGSAGRGFDRSGPASEGEGFSLGTTIVGVRTADAVVVASDQRASIGGMVSSKNVRKVEPLGDGAALAYTGAVSAAQAVTEQVRSERRLYETRRGRRMSTEALASVAGDEIAGMPVPLRAVLAGTDADGPALYTFDGGGGRLAQPFAADGSGGATALGVLEADYEAGLSRGAARDVAVDAVVAASERDTASGNGICLAVIDDGPVTVERYDDPTAARSAS